MKSDDNSIKDVTWENIQKYISEDPYQEFLKQISPSVYKMTLDEKNRPKVVETILKVLQERDPQNATEAYANKIIEAMELVAKKTLETK